MLNSPLARPERVIVEDSLSVAHGVPRAAQEQFLGTVDAWNLRHFKWPFMRALCRPYVEQRELRYYQRQLLSTQRWAMIRCVPHRDAGGELSTHVFDVYALPG